MASPPFRPRKRSAAVPPEDAHISDRSPKKAETLRNLAIVEQALADGMTPLHVMMKNLRWWQERAETAGNVLRAAYPRLEDCPADKVDDVGRIRLVASKLAMDAAPYVHPRLAAIEMTGSEGGPLQMFLDMAPDERKRRLARLADRLGIVPGANPALRGSEGK